MAGEPPRAATRTLADLRVGDEASIVRVGGSGAVLQRLQEMGLVPGVAVRVVRFAPLGDPVEVRVRGYHLSLRKVEAQFVEVAAAPPPARPSAPGAP